MCWASSPKSQPCNAIPAEPQPVQTPVPFFPYHRHRYRQNTSNQALPSIPTWPVLPIPPEEAPTNKPETQNPAFHLKTAGSPVFRSVNPSIYIQNPANAVPTAGLPIPNFPFQKNKNHTNPITFNVHIQIRRRTLTLIHPRFFALEKGEAVPEA